MAADKLKLRVILDAIDRVTGPLKKIQGGSIGAGRALKEARDRLKELNGQQKDVSAWRTQRTAAKQTQEALQAARDRVKAIGQQMKATGVPTRELTASLTDAIANANRLKNEHRRNQVELQGLRTKLSAAGMQTGKLSTAERDLKAKIDATTDAIAKQEARLKRITQQQQRFAKAKQQYERTQGLAGSMAGSGAAGLATGSGILYGAGRALAPGVQAAQQASQISAQTGGDPGKAAEYAAIIKSIRTDGITTDIAAIGTALGAVKSTLGALGDVGNDELSRISRKSLDMAATFGTDVTENIQVASILMQNGLAKNSDHALDLITTGMQNMSAQMRGELPEILHEYSTHFRSMGYSGEEAMSLLINMAKQGKFALDKTGDAIKEFSIRGSDMSKASTEAYEAVGLDTAKMSAAIAQGGKPARAAMMETAKALLAITNPADRANNAIALFGTPIEDLSVDQIPAFLKALAGTENQLGDISGAAGKLGDSLRNNLSGDIDRLTGQLAGIQFDLFEQQSGPLRELTQGLAGLLGSLRTWMKENPGLTGQIFKMVAGLGLLMAVGGGLTLMLASILGPIAMVRYAMSLMAITASGVALPVLAVIAAVVALAGAAYLIYRNWGSVKTFMLGLWAEIRAGFSGGIAGIAATLLNFSPLGLLYRAFAGVLSYLGFELPSKFTGFGGMLMDGLVNGITAGLTRVKDAITGAGGATVDWFKQKLGIHSPSRVFAELGGFTMAGLGQGLAKGEGAVLKQVASTAKQLTAAGAATLAMGMANPGMADQAPLQFDRRPPLTASAGGGMNIAGDTINITINAGPGTDTAELQRMLNRLLDERERGKAQRMRSSLRDTE